MAALPSFLQVGEGVVGRRDELAAAIAVLDEVAAGATRRLVLRGEAGIGKTALAGTVAAAALGRDMAVLAGRCAEDAQLALQPIADALRPVVDALDLDDVVAQLGPRGRFLASVYPRLGAPPADTSPDEARQLLRAALRGLLESVLAERTVVLIVDDVQWAPRATVDLLDEIHREVRGPLLVVLTVRDDERSKWDEDATTHVIALGPLDIGDTSALIARLNRNLAREPRTIEQIHASSAGNPFFVEELALHGRGGDDLPQSLREVVTRRVTLLGPDALTLLTTGAILGGPFDAATLASIAGEPENAVAHVLERARMASLLVRQAHGFDFKHALARDALYTSVTSARRRLIHARIADALIGPPDLVAFHLAASATVDTLDRVAESARNAVRAAGPRWAADVRPLLRRAVDALSLDQRPRSDRAELLSLLTEAEYEAGDTEATWRVAERAAEEARSVGDIALMAKAVKDMGYTMAADAPIARFVELATDALERGRDDDVAVAHAAPVLAWHYSWRGNDLARAQQLTERGLQAAQRTDDPDLVAQALSIRAEVLAGGPDVEQRLRVTEQYIEVVGQLRRRRVYSGFAMRAGALLTAGRRDEFDELCATATRVAEERPWWLTNEVATILKACRMLLDGELISTLVLISPELSNYAEQGITPFIAQAALIARESGRTRELIPMIASVPEHESTTRIVPALLLLAHAETGDLDQASRLLDQVAVDDFAGLYTSYATGCALAMAAEACWHLGDAERAQALARHLRPYGGQLIVIPPCDAAFGAADFYLGLLADAYGDRDTAVARLQAALALCERVRAPLLAGHVAVALARITGDDTLWARARATAERLGAVRLATAVDPFPRQ